MESLEETQQRHRKEKKELQAKIQALKKSATKGDKKKKREVTEEISKLEAEIEKRHNSELSERSNSESEVVEELTEEVGKVDVGGVEGGGGEGKGGKGPSKAARRREKRAEEARAREERVAKEEATIGGGEREKEAVAIRQALATRGLAVKEIPSDGDCLFKAVDEELGRVRGRRLGVGTLRRLAAFVMRSRREELTPFLPESFDEGGEGVSEEDAYDTYCHAVENTKAWGGHIELVALAEGLGCQLEVIQAEGPGVSVGSQGPKLILTYHRHAFGLGEHYNAVQPLSEGEVAEGGGDGGGWEEKAHHRREAQDAIA